MAAFWRSLAIMFVFAMKLRPGSSLSNQPPTHQAQHVYVSQSRGRDDVSCGSTFNPCKTIAMGVWKAQHNGQIYVDGTGSGKNPYPCMSSGLEVAGIHSNKSIVIIGFQSIPHVKCQEGYDIRFNQSLADHNGTTVKLMNLQFVDTCVSGQDIHLYIDNCVFTGARQAINLVQSTSAVSLLFNQSLCVNVSCCITTSITQRIAQGNTVSIYVAHSNVVGAWYDSPLLSYPQDCPSSGINVQSLGEYGDYQPGSIKCDITLKNVTFKFNVMGENGLIHLSLENAFSSLDLDGVVFTGTKLHGGSMGSIIHIASSHNHETILISTRFSSNFIINWSALEVHTSNSSTLHISNSQFEDFKATSGFQNRLLHLTSDDDCEVHIENTTFTNTSNIGCISLTSRTARVTIRGSSFRHNSVYSCGAVMWLSTKDRLHAIIKNSHFESSSAGGPAGMAGFESHNVKVEIIDSTINGSTSSSGAGGVLNIGYSACGSSIPVNNATLLLRNVQIIGAYCADGSGGVAAIKAQTGSITMQDSVIKDVAADGLGGSFYAYSDGSGIGFHILNSTVKQSRSFASGGFLFCNSVNQLTLENVTLDSIRAELLSEGGLFVDSDNLTVNIRNLIIKNTTGSPGGRLHLKGVSTLNISNSIFESNYASSYSGGCLYLFSISHAQLLLKNVTFKSCYTRYSMGGAILFHGESGKIAVESCNFYDNEAANGMAGAMAFQFSGKDKVLKRGCIRQRNSMNSFNQSNQNDIPHRVWAYTNYVTITYTTFSNNVAINGGALSLSSGSYIIKNCSFVDNFAKLRGGHILLSSVSTNTTIINASFLQQHPASKRVQSIYSKDTVTTFNVATFIDSESLGPLIILNSSLESRLPTQEDLKTLIFISKANYVNFGENKQTLVSCPQGNLLNVLKFTTQIDTAAKESESCFIELITLKFTCKPCWVGSYSLQHGKSLGLIPVSGFRCLPCPFGAECLHRLTAKPNFWGYRVQENPPTVSFLLCPEGYCKHQDSKDVVDYNSCHGNRTGQLCGQCKEGYVETLLSPSCRRQDECQDTWLMGVAVAMVMLMGLFFIHKPRLLRMVKRHILWFRNKMEEDRSMDDNGGGYLKIVFYFYQVAKVLLIDTSYDFVLDSYLLQPLVGLFNFEIRFSSRGLLCPIVGLTAVTKQLLFACPVIGILLMIALCYGCHCLLHKWKSINPPTLGSYFAAALETLLLGYAVLVNMALKLLRCTSIRGELWLFIAGNEVCYQWWQYLLMVFVVVSVFPFIVTLALGSRWLYKDSISTKEFFIGCVIPLPYLIYKMASFLCRTQELRAEPREWKEPVTAVLYGPFRKPQDNTTGAIYWESILISRRLVLIIIYVFVSDPLLKAVLLTLTCVAILCHHTIVRPFCSQPANITEMVSLFGLVVIAAINTYNASFLSFGEVKRGPLLSYSKALNWIQAVILIACPVLCCLAVVVAILSHVVRMGVQIGNYVKYSCIKSRGWFASDDQIRRLLEPSTLEDEHPR